MAVPFRAAGPSLGLGPVLEMSGIISARRLKYSISPQGRSPNEERTQRKGLRCALVCDQQSKVPHTDLLGNSPPGSTPKNAPPGPPLTPKQRETHDNQQEPENQWVPHPAVDGCKPFRIG